jgi:high affinity sulfate transporter 1
MTSTPATPSTPSPQLPAPPRGPLAWLRASTPASLSADALAGVTLAAYLIPAAIGDASLAGLPPQAGLYACLFSALVFWLLCGSRHTSITVTSAISLLLGTSLAPLANADPQRAAALAACTALLVGALSLAAWALRAGALVNFISETVLIGFKLGVALTLASSQLPKLLGIPGAHGGFWSCSRHVATHLPDTNTISLLVGLAALALLIAGRAFFRHKPVALLVVALAILVAHAAHLDTRGVKMLGDVPRGLPTPGLPLVSVDDLNTLLPLAMACFLLGAVETAAIGRMFAARHAYRLDPNRELLALAGANLMAGLGRGFPVSGGMSQSLVNEGAGARTPVSSFIAALIILAVLLFLSSLLRFLPQPVLAAIVLMAVPGLVNLRALRRLWHAARSEFFVAAAAFAGVLASGLLQGVLIGAVISMLLLIRRASRPHVAFLGRIPGSRRYSDLERHPDNEQIPGILIARPEGSIVYFNADHVFDTILAQAQRPPVPARAVVCDLSASPHVDLAGAEMLKHLAQDLRARGAALHLVEVRSAVRDRLRADDLERFVGPIDRHASVAGVIETLEHTPAAST